MENLRRLLPSFRGLIAFEVAGRLGSFTRAGAELGMSQAAISYAIRALEDDLGQTLFEREHRRVRLTEAGRLLHADVTDGLGALTRGIKTVGAMQPENMVTLSVSTAFATLWFAPKMQKMREDLPDIDLRLQTADRDIDLVTEDIPLGIRGGRPSNWNSYDSARLEIEEIVAVASPAYVARNGIPATPWGFLDHALAHLDEPHRHAVTWDEWLRSAGVASARSTRGMRANEYVAVLQMALDGDAIALGWRHLVEPFIENGRLIRMSDHTMKTGTGFYVVWPRGRALSQACQRVRDWMLEQARDRSA